MSIETATYISDLNSANPGATDLKAEGDDHMRLIKTVVKATFPNITGAVTPTHTVINNLAAGTFPAVAVTGVTDLTTTGNTILGDATTDTFNVGNNGIVKSAAGVTTISAPNGSATSALTVQGGTTAGDRGVDFKGGTGAGDFCAIFRSAAGTNYFTITGDGALNFSPLGVAKLTLSTAGAITAAGPLSGVTTLAMGGALSGVTTLAMGGALSGVTTLNASGLITTSAGAATTPNAIGNSGTAFTLDCSKSNVQTLTMTGNVSGAGFTINNPQDGQTINLFITQDGVGTRTLGYPAAVKWAGGTAGVLSTPINSVDLLVMTYRAATTFWYAALMKAFS